MTLVFRSVQARILLLDKSRGEAFGPEKISKQSFDEGGQARSA
jgi:hypothetical protein